jgi:glycerol-3-phosphate dehydrogenase (NAD(P)+)
VARGDQRRAAGNPYLEGRDAARGDPRRNDLAAAVRGASWWSRRARAVRARVMARRPTPRARRARLVSATKGIELGTLLAWTRCSRDVPGPARRMERFCVLSGPSFAVEVAARAPTAVVAASRDEEPRRVQELFQTGRSASTRTRTWSASSSAARSRTSSRSPRDVAGLGFGHNTLAPAHHAGLAEITRLGLAMGARRDTFYGLAGMGDLVLTCTGLAQPEPDGRLPAGARRDARRRS